MIEQLKDDIIIVIVSVMWFSLLFEVSHCLNMIYQQ